MLSVPSGHPKHSTYINSVATYPGAFRIKKASVYHLKIISQAPRASCAFTHPDISASKHDSQHPHPGRSLRLHGLHPHHLASRAKGRLPQDDFQIHGVTGPNTSGHSGAHCPHEDGRLPTCAEPLIICRTRPYWLVSCIPNYHCPFNFSSATLPDPAAWPTHTKHSDVVTAGPPDSPSSWSASPPSSSHIVTHSDTPRCYPGETSSHPQCARAVGHRSCHSAWAARLSVVVVRRPHCLVTTWANCFESTYDLVLQTQNLLLLIRATGSPTWPDLESLVST